MELEKAAKHGAQHGVKIKKMWDPADGYKVIAIGGDKLARGLTLEGLCTSYFLRASRMYDTLMQMGRWFGYRPGYLDLCRLYTTPDLIDWFGHIADASEELREEFDLMQASGGTPRDYGLKVQSHSVLMVTSRLKMRSAKTLMLSFSGQVVETVAFHRDSGVLRSNLKALRSLIDVIGAPDESPRIERMRPGVRHQYEGALWRSISADRITTFLAGYKTHPDAYKTDARLLAEFIDSMSKGGELTSWTVAVLGGGDRNEIDLGQGISVKMPKRTHRSFTADRFSIGRLLAPRDEAIDLDASAWAAALDLTREAWKADAGRNQASEPDTPNGIAIRRVRGFGAHDVQPRSESGLLLLYVLDPKETGVEFPTDVEGIVGLGISFPGSRSGVKVEYKVNNVLWEQEYGSSE
ncbi:MAG: Z1 domain-containing protein [Acetobacteraceae bacterium]